MAIQLRKAQRQKAKLRIGVTGPSGSGKTYSALLLARGLAESWEKIAVIDTENGSAELYSNMGGYNVITLDAPYSPERYIEAIRVCEKAGMEVIVLDSVSHEWDGAGGCLESNEKLAGTKFKGNTWAAWSETTPKHRSFIETIIASPCHIVTTTRSKTDMIQTEDKKIKKVGLKEIQREGFEYELTVNFNIDREKHYAIASKDRTGLFENADPFIVSEETGKKLKDWNEGGKLYCKRCTRDGKQTEIDVEQAATSSSEFKLELCKECLEIGRKTKVTDPLPPQTTASAATPALPPALPAVEPHVLQKAVAKTDVIREWNERIGAASEPDDLATLYTEAQQDERIKGSTLSKTIYGLFDKRQKELVAVHAK